MVRESTKLKKQNDAMDNSERAAGVFMQLLALLPAEQQDIMLSIIMDEQRLQEPERFQELFYAPLEHLDLETNRSEIVRLLLELIPVEQLVPPIYEKYRPMVADAANVILSSLSQERLRIKLVEQMLLPFEATLPERLISLIARMPTLQKLGQIIARNRNLHPKFRKLLQKLENGIKDATYDSILAKVNQELKHQIKAYKVKIGGRFLAEASVCAVVPFTWHSPNDGTRRKGVFKVIKPFINGYWTEELKILEVLANYLDQNRNRYGLPTIGFRELLKEVRELLKKEVKLPIEQERLLQAQEFYAKDEDVRIPQLLPMKTDSVTGMEFLEGQKVTIAANRFPENRRRIAELVLDKLVISVLFNMHDEALFHADPHAGNLFYSKENDELVLFDWGLSCTLKRSGRREIVQLILGFILNDQKRAIKAACALTEGKLTRGQEVIIERKVLGIFASLPKFPLVRLEPLTRLLDELILDGIRFPAELLMFRKSLFTLIGVLYDVDSEFNIDWHLTHSLFSQVIREVPNRLTHSPWSYNYPTQITTWDLRGVVLRLSQIAAQLGLELAQLLAQFGLEKATEALYSSGFPFARPLPAKS
ncbi:MAG: hypothetical protein HY819_04405 [Acidobacteria bacterium]|nr:hypothetical protein [Acidobacteriota bacterium]